MTRVLIRGGRVVDPSQGLDEVRDLLLEEGHVAASSASLADLADAPDIDIFDAFGLVVAPGFIDGRVHLGEPGFEERETLQSGLRAAVAGGYTAVVALPDSDPVNDTRAVTEMLRSSAEALGLARLYPMAAVSKGLRGEKLAELGELAEAGAVAACDAEHTLGTAFLRRALLYAQHADLPIVHRARDCDLEDDGVMHEGEWSTRLGLPGCPGMAEEMVIARDLLLLADTGGRYHLSPVTTAGGVARVREGKASGLALTCEVTPHHLVLSDQEVLTSGFDPATRVAPPLRSADDVEALRAALADGTVDMIASDHRPYHRDHKLDVQFSASPPGIVGLETTVGVCLDRLVGAGVIDVMRLVELLSTGPARVFGLPGGSLEVGRPADVTVLDLDATWRVDPEGFHSLGRATPFAGEELRGRASAVFVGGRRVDA
ncbi:MAG: dihydroorotase [Acidobacteriota bacterium]